MPELKRSLGPVQFFSLGFGTIIGVGWIVFMGLWYTQAGPVGAAVAFLLGGLLMAFAALCYAEVGSMFPVAGGEAVYAFRAFGPTASFVAGWAMVLMMTAVVPYVSVSLAWILDVLVPGIGGPVLYTWRGQPIHALGLAIALAWTFWLGFLNYRGIKGAAKFQDWLTYGKIAISVLFFGAGIFGGGTANLEPMFQPNASGSIWPGLIAVMVTTPWFFGGFNSLPQTFEERSPTTTTKTLGWMVVLSVMAAAAYYALAAIATGMVGPWQEIVGAELPVAAAFRKAFGSELFARIVLLAGLFGIVTVGNGASIAATRLLFALGRARMIPASFTRLHPKYGSPVVGIIFVTAFGLLGNFLGRSGVAPIVNVGSAAACLAYLSTSLSVWRLRRLEPDRPRPFRVPLGVPISLIASAGSLFLLISAVRQHWIDAKGGFPMEWAVIIAWAILGGVMWRAAAKERQGLSELDQRRIIGGDAT
jgi:amino acid transporter